MNNIDNLAQKNIAYYHLPGLFEFYDLYKVFLEIYKNHREYFYDWCEIGSIYGAPADCLWGGGRVGFGDNNADEVMELLEEYGISARLTFSNSLLRDEHLNDRKCNRLCSLFEREDCQNGVIVHSDLLVNYLQKKYPGLYLVSSTTKVITEVEELINEVNRSEFKFVVPDFRLNKKITDLDVLQKTQKDKIEFLCNECCYIGCNERKACYESVSHKSLGDDYSEHICVSPDRNETYRFSKAMRSPAFIGIDDIKNIYLPRGFSNFKIEGRSLGSAVVLEFLLYYMTKPEYQINVREEIYLDSSLDLF